MTFALILVAFCVVLSAVGQVLMKSGMNQIGEIGSLQQLLDFRLLFSIFTNPYIIGGVLCFVLQLVIWLAAMSSLNISFMYPLASLVYVLTAVIAVVFLHEDVNLMRWAGIFLVVGGCFLVGQS
jgi:drug/metabolite transporter (DMT)-like permease